MPVFLPNKHSVWGVIGKTGSGKSSLVHFIISNYY